MEKRQRVTDLSMMAKIIIAALVLACAISSLAQTRSSVRNSARSRAFAPGESRAEVAAEELVSLSADTIVGLLRTEPGLLLEVKKILVRKAYEQGRLLDPRELDDDALFRLIQDDPNVRVLVTHEIEDRNYIPLKPSREEMGRAQAGRPTEPKIPPPSPAPPLPQKQPAPSALDASGTS